MPGERYGDRKNDAESASGSSGLKVTPAPAVQVDDALPSTAFETNYAPALGGHKATDVEATDVEASESAKLKKPNSSRWSTDKLTPKKSRLKKQAKQKIIIGIISSFMSIFVGGFGGLGMLSAGRMFILEGAMFEKFNRPMETKLARHSFRSMKPVFDDEGNFVGRTKMGRYGKALDNTNKSNILDDIKAAGWEPDYDPNDRSLLGFVKNGGDEVIGVDEFKTFGRRQALGEVMKDVYPRGRLRRSVASRLVSKEIGGSSRFLFVEKKLGKAEKAIGDNLGSVGSKLDEARNRLRKRMRTRVIGGDNADIQTAAASKGKNSNDYTTDENGDLIDQDGNKVDPGDVEVLDDAAKEATEDLAEEVNDAVEEAIAEPQKPIRKFTLGSDSIKSYFGDSLARAKNPSIISVAQIGAFVCTLSNYSRAITDEGRSKREAGARRLDHINTSGSQQSVYDDGSAGGDERAAFVSDFSETKNPEAEINSSPAFRRVLMGDERVENLGEMETYSLNPTLPSPWAGITQTLKLIPAGVCGVVTDAKFQIGAVVLELGITFLPGAGQSFQAIKESVKQGVIQAAKSIFTRKGFSKLLRDVAVGAGIGAMAMILKEMAVSSLTGLYGDNTAEPAENITAWMGGRTANAGADARGMGAPPLTGAKAITYQREAEAEIVTEYASMPWYKRWFSPSAPRSLTAYAILNTPSTPSVVAKNATRYALGPTLPSSFFSANGTFSKYAHRIISNGSVYAQTQGNVAKELYGITPFGWTEADAERFPDPVENATYVNSSPEMLAKYEAFEDLCFESSEFSEYESDECYRDDDEAWRFRKYRYSLMGIETMAEDSNPEYLNSKLAEVSGQSQSSASTGATPTLANGDAVALGKKILDTGRVTFDQGQDRQDIATGQGTACGSPAINIHVYQLIDAILTQFPNVNIRFGAINSGHRCNSGQHPKGEAFDIGNEEIAAEIMPWMHANYQTLNIYEMVYNGQSQYSIDNGAPIPGMTWAAHDDHIHIGVKP